MTQNKSILTAAVASSGILANTNWRKWRRY
jgi:hypothetical protein